jgi:hypothetical protein
MRQVTIYHNIATKPGDAATRPLGMLDGYSPGHPLVPVFRYQSDLTLPALLEAAFEMFNVGDTDTARAYRAPGNRSLSVGDVVQAGDSWYSCERSGWKSIPAPAYVAGAAHAYGSHSCLDPL